MRVGINPAKAGLPAYTPQRLGVALIVYIPVLEGYFHNSLEIFRYQLASLRASTVQEFDLLVFLARTPRQVYTRAQLLRHVWASSERWQDDNTVAEHIYRIRRKLDPDDRNRWIETVRGVGYRFARESCGATPDTSSQPSP